MRPEVRRQMRAQELRAAVRDRGHCLSLACMKQVAGRRLVDTYEELAERRAHLFGSLLGGQAPRQWDHYPEEDAISRDAGFQWFYHSHPPEDRPGAAEHGHIHLFARRKLWSRRLRSARELAFQARTGAPRKPVNTRHLLGVGFDARGVPISLFTVNSWVTGDLMLSASSTAALLGKLSLDTGHGAVDAVLGSLVCLFDAEIRSLLHARDQRLLRGQECAVLSDESVEVLSEIPINLDEKLAHLQIGN